MFASPSNDSNRSSPAPEPNPLATNFHPEPTKSAESATPRIGPKIELVEGDLLTQKVDVIVNAWNRNLIPHWMLVTQGVSGAIKRAGGRVAFSQLGKFGVLPLGSARLTNAGGLPFKGIIHVAGINHAWKPSEKSIRDSVINALAIAKKENFGSIAFPAIGAGSSIKIGGHEVPIWGVSESKSLQFIADQVSKCDYLGRVIIVKYRHIESDTQP